MSNAKDKANEANGVEANPDEILTSGDIPIAPEVGMDATSVDKSDLAQGAAVSSQGAKLSGETFTKATIIAVISDPENAYATFDQDAKIKGKIRNYNDLKRAPRGSLLVKMLDEKVDDSYEVVFPFMQSHLMLPASIGETVWILSAGGLRYWFSRVAGSSVSEDVNHTHVDRDLITPTENKDTAKDKEEKQNGQKKNKLGTFLSGLGSLTKREATTQEDAKPEELLNNTVYKPTQHEAIPRFKPQAGDLVLQGSHNTLISFSTDRGWSKTDEEFTESNSNQEWKPGTGTIDIVVGRGALPKDAEEVTPTTADEKGTLPPRTGPRLMTNVLGAQETDKMANLNDLEGNPAEGDPDFHTDLSRIYVSMLSPIDQKLSLQEQSPTLAGDVPVEDQEGPSIALKSNQIRIVARDEGSIRIVKEGDLEGDEPNLATIILQPDGSIHLVGEKIFFGKSVQDGGHEEVDPQGPEGEAKMNPYVLFSVLQKYLEDVHSSIDSFCQTLLTHQTPGYGAPSPQVNTAANTLKTEMATHKKLIEQLASKRIFGE